ncbi:helix-turn-helix transcriptional regulator [Chelativorans sp. YIM 93263]|uniref:helix-turn-helix transcriptional regulator n=1 Tax=Chelativorans sp. YIM 93263 TaxID=2906648 RepID=UPI00237960E7|nr:helix-turn-helix domain-containing protein [Chelativorans sp. YIM 93263]
MTARGFIDRPVPRIGMRINDVALSLGVSPNTILKLVEEGRLPRPRVWNRTKIWRVAEIDAALAEWPTDRPVDEPEPEDLEEWRAEA